VLEEISNTLSSVDSEWGEKMSKAGAILCDNINARIESADTLGGDGIKINIPKGGSIQPFSPLSIKEGTYAPSEVLMGEFRVLKATGAKKATFKKVSNAELPGKFAFSPRKLSKDEQKLIPDIPDWYIVPKEVVRIAQHAQVTTSSSQPMRNFMMRGPAGVGKTEGARAIASALNLPYLSLTCSANTEIFDLLGQILPDVEGIDGAVIPSGPAVENPEIPTFEDIQMDAATAYEEMTGIYDEDISHESVYQKLLEVIKETTAKELQDSADIEAESETSPGQKFRYIETTLVRAMKYGYVIEVQEPSVIANPGVLVGLNSLLDNCKQITLPTGETIHRHPDTVVVVTTNSEYAGCRDVNQSVISRMNLVFDLDEPTEKELVDRVAAITGCEDTESLKIMADVVKAIQERSRELSITDGSCGMRELIAWTQSFMITGSMTESAEFTILSSLSATPENREEIRETCVTPRAA
jgi:MoxR-like ATPase